MLDRNTIRQRMRQQRRALTSSQQQVAAVGLAHQLLNSRLFTHSQNIALYLPNDGEIDPTLLLGEAWQRGKKTFLPVLGLRGMNRLWFLPFADDSTLISNRFGISEPVHQRRDRLFKPQRLDLVLMPLVAFDQQGNRLGMGGGFYDRTLAFLQHRHSWRKPRLVGLAYEFQRVDTLPIQHWDVPLDAIATESGIYDRDNRQYG